MSSRKRVMPHGRPTRKRARAKRFLVITNGEVTEKQYFDHLNSCNSKIAITTKTKSIDPENLAKMAKSIWKTDQRESSSSSREGRSDSYERVFVVSDVDDYTVAQFKAANTICKNKPFDLIISNPCFEVWLIDHMEVCPESIQITEDAKNRARSLGLTTGSDNKEVVIEAIEDRYESAMQNAEAHMSKPEQRTKRENLDRLDFGPWSDMPIVVRSLIQEFS